MDELARQHKAQTCFANFCGLIGEYDPERAKECLICELLELCFKTTELRSKVRPQDFFPMPRVPYTPNELVAGMSGEIPFDYPDKSRPIGVPVGVLGEYDAGFPKCFGQINEQSDKESLTQCGKCSVKSDCLVRAAALFMREIQGHLNSGEDWKKGKQEADDKNEEYEHKNDHDAT